MIVMMAVCRGQSWLGKSEADALKKPSTSAPEFSSFTTRPPTDKVQRTVGAKCPLRRPKLLCASERLPVSYSHMDDRQATILQCWNQTPYRGKLKELRVYYGSAYEVAVH